TERWSMTIPHPSYLVTLVAGEFKVAEKEWDGLPLQFLAEPRYAQWIEPLFAKTPDILEFFSNVTQVRYPYPKYSQACVDNFPWGGMENISATTLTPLALTDERGRRDTDSGGLLAHEAAHQWFGDLLTCKDWSHIWLNEGFATYMTLLYLEKTDGLDAFRIGMRDAQDRYVEKDRGAGRRPTVTSLWRDPEDLMDEHAYAGAAARLNLLRFILGDGVFQDGLRAYVAANAGRSVVTADFQRAMEKVSGRGLDTFFQQWFYGRGYPEFDLDWSFDADEETIRIEVRQVQGNADGTPAVFQVPVEIVVRDEGGTVSHRVDLRKRREVFEFPVAGRPIYVRFDHGSWIPKEVTWRNRGVRELLAIAHEDDDVTGRREAVRALGERAGTLYAQRKLDEVETIVAELVDRLTRDSSKAVRAAAAEALGKAASLEARERLLTAASRDEEASVREACLDALTAFGVSPDLAAAGRSAFDEGYSWRTMAAGAGLVASAAPNEAYAYLTEKLFIDSPHDVLRGYLLTRIGELENAGVDEQLRRWANDESSDPTARAAAIRALGKRPRDRVANHRFVLRFLEDDSFAVRAAAVDVLADYGGGDARRALREYYPLARSSQERRRIERALSSPGLVGS
ncbi:MAG TPA: hypothetical protein ENJ09_06365, partial [Planctomycetes bacterium]|nr:hypothetical protein [Planctomycetota bacterium]